MRIERTLVAGLSALCLGAGAAQAQTIRGVVVDGGDRPVSGVVVSMLDSTSTVVARILSNERGEFRVGASRAGTYRVRTMRIGYRPALTDPMVVLLGGEVEKRVALSSVLVALDTVRVVDRNSCRITSDSTAAATFAALEQARTALSATQLTLSGRNISATTVAYDRMLDAEGRRVTQQSSRTTTAYVTQPWRAISPDSTHRAGFVVVANDNSTTYFAPSIDMLLSNVFIEDHCFRMVTDRKQPELVGVAFEPSPDRRKLPEIKGTLWMNKKSAELQRLEYRYVNLSSEQENAGAGGDVSFARLKNGGWVVSRWNIRMPVLEQVVRSQALGGNATRVVAIQMTGGEIQLATRTVNGAVDTVWSRPGPSLKGTVIDSARGTPIANARVDLLGALLSATTDDRGRFTIANVMPGTYRVEAWTPELEAIGAANQSTIAFTDSTASYQIRVPNAAQLTAAVCAGRTLSSSEAAVIGRAYQRGDTVPAAGARVVAEWAVVSGDSHVAKELEGKASQDGIYRLCGAPMNTTVTVMASTDAASSDPRPLLVSTRIARADLLVDRAVTTTAKFTGKVLVDSSKTPIDGAEIYFPELGKVGHSSASGAFEVGDISPGEQHVIVRRVGYGLLDTKLTFQPNATLDRQIFLSRVNLLDSVVVRDRMTERAMADFETNRRLGLGHFMDRAELEKMPNAKLSHVVVQWPGIQLAFGSGNRSWITGTRKPMPMCQQGQIMPGTAAAKCYENNGFYVPDLTEISVGAHIACYSQVWIDGVMMNRGSPTRPFEVTSTLADQIEAVEWYAGPSETPGRYSDLNAECGVLVVHMRRPS